MELDLMFLLSSGLISTLFLAIVIRIGLLWRDERAARRRRELLRETMDEVGAGAGRRQQADQQNRRPLVVAGRRVAGAARARHRAQRADDDDDFAPGAVVDDRPVDSDASDQEEDGGGPAVAQYDADGKKIGRKKLAKLEAKAERRAQREAELVEREERKRAEAEKEEQRKKREEEEKLEEERRLKKEKEEKEERERKEHEEYLQMKAAFSVEDEGYDAMDEEQEGNLLAAFIDYVRTTKVVSMDELASRFSLKPNDAVERLRAVVDSGALAGVEDDRGKFICITEDEFAAVAKFINQRGRVSVAELADYSNKLIRLEPEKAAD